MARILLDDNGGWMTVDIEVNGPVLGAALEHEEAESIVRCAVMMALSALAADDPWPRQLLDSMAHFLSSMRNDVSSARLI